MTNSEKNSTSYSDYYEENLYGLQNGVLNIVKNLDVPFYLTGGTALSRGYYHHRYSDDLDFFVNCDAAFAAHTESVLADLKKNGYTWDSEIDFIKTVDFYSVTVHHSILISSVNKSFNFQKSNSRGNYRNSQKNLFIILLKLNFSLTQSAKNAIHVTARNTIPISSAKRLTSCLQHSIHTH